MPQISIKSTNLNVDSKELNEIIENKINENFINKFEILKTEMKAWIVFLINDKLGFKIDSDVFND